MPSGGSGHDSTVQSYLQRAGYRNQELTKRDVMNALHHYRGLHPKLDKFVFNDGRQRELLCLEGTIPVNYKGATYNIPIAIWPLDTHPNHAPMCYVRPTPDMEIRMSRNVDRNGTVYHPYLHEWNSGSSDILCLIQMMIITFSEQPPVFAKPPPGQRPPQPPPMMTTSTPYPPAGGGGMPMYPPQHQRPAPYPPAAGGGPAAAQPPYPMSQPPYMPAGGGQPPYMPAYAGGGGPAAAAAGPAMPYPPYASQGNNGPVVTTAGTGGGGGSQLASNDSGTISKELIKASMQSAVEQKVRKELADDFNTKQAEIQNLREIEEQLTAGKNQLQTTLQKLDAENQDLDKLCASMRSEKEELEVALDKLENEENNDEDENGETNNKAEEKIVTVTPLHKQIVQSYSEDLAISDAIYYLSEALRKGVVDCESFLKLVRDLARKQFFVRATMQKAREKAGLAV